MQKFGIWDRQSPLSNKYIEYLNWKHSPPYGHQPEGGHVPLAHRLLETDIFQLWLFSAAQRGFLRCEGEETQVVARIWISCPLTSSWFALGKCGNRRKKILFVGRIWSHPKNKICLKSLKHKINVETLWYVQSFLQCDAQISAPLKNLLHWGCTGLDWK